MHKDIDPEVTHRMINGFAVIPSRYGTTERKTEMSAARVASNLELCHKPSVQEDEI